MNKEYSMSMRSQLETEGVEEHVYRIGDEVVTNEPMRTGKYVNKRKLREIELELGSENVESGGETASTNTPLQMGMKMCKNVGLNSSSDQTVPTIAGNLGMMHKLVLAGDVLPDDAALHYVVRGMTRLVGFKRDGGIHCTHCHNVVSASQFEIHAGYALRRKPYDNIFTSNGLSLHKLAIDKSRNLISTSEENDDICSICKDGGDMFGCKTCPRACHVECVGLTNVPQETWNCGYCQDMFEKANLEKQSANAIATGREITQRSIRIVETLPDIGGCAICSGHDFTEKAFDDRTVIICDQCEKEYHVGCLREKQMADLKVVPKGEWFCCKQCNNINSTLKKWIAMGDLFLPEDLSNVVKKKAAEQKLDIKWRLLNGRRGTEKQKEKEEEQQYTKKLLSDVVSIFNNRFDPIADSTTASVDLIPYLVNGRDFNGQDYRGMHCAILTVNSVVVSAAIFRVFGEEVAEIPLVATKSDCQRKGYFQSLFFCILGLLAYLDVKNLVLPAADEAESFWQNRFGFSKLDRKQLYNLKKHHQNLMIFEETSILHKSITKFEV